jgi:hypothetical protein
VRKFAGDLGKSWWRSFRFRSWMSPKRKDRRKREMRIWRRFRLR